MISIQRGVTVLVAVLVVAGMVVPGAAVAAHTETGPPSNIPQDQLFTVSDDGQVSAWERAAYPLRTDDTDAATRVPAPETLQGERLGAGNSFTDGNDGVDSKSFVREFDGERNPMGVHSAGQDVTITFDANLASSGEYDQLDSQDDVELVAARLTPVEGAELPADTDAAVDLLSDIDAANTNASFRMLNDSAAFDSSGRYSQTETFEPGYYVVFAAVHQSDHDGIETDSTGNIAVDGPITVVGMDTLTVQQSATGVDEPSNSNPGDTLTFDVDTTGAFDASADGGVTHAVAVYRASTFDESRFDLVVDESALGPDFSMSKDAQLEHSIATVNGVTSVEPGTKLNGNDLTDGEIRRPVDAAAVVDFLASEAGADDPSTHPITNGGEDNGEFESIDASVTAVNGADRATTVSVDTFGNFSRGSYRYVVVSTLDDNESQVSTTTGRITLSEASSGSGGGGGGGSGGGGIGPIVRSLTPAAGGSVSTTVQSLARGQTVTINVEEGPTADGATLDQLRLTSTDDASDVQFRITQADAPGDGVPANDRDRSALSYINVETTNLPNEDGTPGTFTFTVSEERLAALDAQPDGVQLSRYHDGEWQSLETTHLGGNRFEAATPGFSWFAVGVQDGSASVTDASLSSTTVATNESATVTAVVENNGTTAQEVTLNLTVDGERLQSRTVTAGPGETTETFTVRAPQAGSYDITVNGASAGTLTVTESGAVQTPTPTLTDRLTEGGPDFEPGGIQPLSIVLVFVVVVGTALLAYAYRRTGP